ncbi:MAG: hypothetical protein ACK4TC_06175 [Sphingomonas pseudosanguinis]|uniref:hypothetical protein n=1 Tax=Sphingomonas pseudosanguinis TaxID=413712 RepID=UPI00391AD575
MAEAITLTDAQDKWLTVLVAYRAEGRDFPRKHSVLCALERRGLAEWRGTRAEPRNERWFVSPEGMQRYTREMEARGISTPKAAPPPSSHWFGTEVRGSRWTRQQLIVLDRAGCNDPEQCRTVEIDVQLKHHPTDWTLPAPKERRTLPALAITRDGRRAKVVMPSGWTEWKDIVRG